MSELKRLYIQGLENHAVLVEHNTSLAIWSDRLLNDRYDGNEDMSAALTTLGSGFASLGGGLLSVAGWVGGKALSGLSFAVGGAGNLLSHAFSDNDVLIKKILQQFSRSDESEISFSASKVALLTSDGDLDTLERDMDALLANLTLIDKHGKDLISFLDKRMGILRELKNVKTTEDVFKVIDKYGEVSYPVLALKHSRGEDHWSDQLPNGKVFAFKEGANKYLMSGDSPEGSASSMTMSKSEVSNLLNKLDKVNGMHKRFKSNYDGYLSFIRSWAEMVKTVEGNLGGLEKVSKSALGEAEKFLGGDPDVLAFYSGFTPRVVSYTDRYIHGVLGVFA
jgi:hypothetical protein